MCILLLVLSTILERPMKVFKRAFDDLVMIFYDH